MVHEAHSQLGALTAVRTGPVPIAVPATGGRGATNLSALDHRGVRLVFHPKSLAKYIIKCRFYSLGEPVGLYFDEGRSPAVYLCRQDTDGTGRTRQL
jgi:hypothetical protein